MKKKEKNERQGAPRPLMRAKEMQYEQLRRQWQRQLKGHLLNRAYDNPDR